MPSLSQTVVLNNDEDDVQRIRMASPTKSTASSKSRPRGHHPHGLSPFNLARIKTKFGRARFQHQHPNRTEDIGRNVSPTPSPPRNRISGSLRSTTPSRGSSPSRHSRGNVLARLHALFPSHQSGSSNNVIRDTSSDLAPVTSRPPVIPQPDIPKLDIPTVILPPFCSSATTPVHHPRPPKPPKPAPRFLKIRIVTWNHGYSLPKGDLETLLGSVPPYEPSEPDPADPTGLPKFKADDLHPYHIIVIAGQECPSQSNMPLGLGAGFRMELRDRERRLERAKSKRDARERDREQGPDEGKRKKSEESTRADPDGARDFGMNSQATNQSIPAFLSVPTPSSPNMPSQHSHWPKAPSLQSLKSHSTPNVLLSSSASAKGDAPPVGWTTILEDWFVNGASSGQNAVKSSTSQTSIESDPLPLAPVNHPIPLISPLPIHGTALTPSPLSNLPTPSASPSPSHTSNFKINDGKETPPPPKGKKGPYELLTKERLMGIYIAVFVHRDVVPHVQAMSKSSVTAGLIGGRLGNKGGIGVSMKVAGTSLLFINAHLAAHEGRNEARLANMAKIKAELAVETFLEPDDPRTMAEDITDRFDHSFLFGDLNFRLNVTRLHAEWLVSRKDYATALEFDQLRQAMKSGEAFNGFSEATVNFPPTFKYDVLRTLKKSRSVRAAITEKASRHLRSSKVALGGGDSPLSEVDEKDDGSSDSSSSDDEGEPEAQSIVSSYKSNHSRYTTTDGDASDDLDNASNEQLSPATQNAIANASSHISMHHKIFYNPTAQRAKTKLLSLVNPVNIPPFQAGPSRTRPSSPTKPPGDGLLSPLSPPPPRIRSKSDAPPPTTPTRPKAIPSADATMSPSQVPLPPSAHRAASTKSNGAKSGPEENAVEGDDRGVYDSSSKQRVPSWCDRILFKTTVVPDPDPEPEEDEPKTVATRMSQFFANFKRGRRDSVVSASSGEGSNISHTSMAPQHHSPATTTQTKEPTKSHPFGRLFAPHKSPKLDRSSSLTADPASAFPPSPASPPSASMTVNGRRKSFSAPLAPHLINDSPPSTPKLVTSATFPLTVRPSIEVEDLTNPSVVKSTVVLSNTPSPGPANGPRRWFSLLTPKESALLPPPPILSVNTPAQAPRKGDMVCLDYDTLDDREMRKLEGRSDHRPVTGAFAVYL